MKEGGWRVKVRGSSFDHSNRGQSATLLALQMEKAVSLGMPAEAGKGQETHSPLQPQNTQPHGHLDFSSMKLMSEVYSTELEENKFELF